MTAQLQSYARCQLRASRPLALCAPLPFPVHFCTPVLLTTHTWFASGYRRRSRRLPVVVDVLDTTIFITILLARPFGEVVLQLLFWYVVSSCHGLSPWCCCCHRLSHPGPAPSPPPASYHCPRQGACCLGAVCAQHHCAAAARQVRSCCITPFRCLVSPVTWLRGGGGPSTFVLGPQN